MKKEYTIGEICKLYRIGQDSMRYYEKMGLITPKRRANGYRIYTIEEAWRLNIIKDLRKLNFSVKQIKAYLEDRSIQTTKELIAKEIDFIQEEIRLLVETEKNLKRRLDFLKSIEHMQTYEKLFIQRINDRKIIVIEEALSKDGEIDLALRKLQRQTNEKIFLFGNKNMGVSISAEGMKKGIYNLYQNVFFLVDDTDKNYDTLLPGGDYLILSYKGAYSKSQRFIEKMLAYIKENGYQRIGNPIEIYRIEIHQTAIEEEFITEIQIPITTK
ncbi:MerR family transcriptional regulator [Clostridiaceae bacterium 35-E11]